MCGELLTNEETRERSGIHCNVFALDCYCVVMATIQNFRQVKESTKFLPYLPQNL